MGKVPSKTDEKFMASLVEAGGERLAPTNPYEVLRFKTRYGVGVVYENARGKRTWNNEASSARQHLDRKAGSLATVKVVGRRRDGATAHRLHDRDGDACFLCGLPLGEDVTVEHLVAIAHGGPNHISNLFLAHAKCNQSVGHLSAPEKIAVAIKARS